MSEEDWVKAAMADDTVVVNLLVRLNQVSPTKTESPAFPFDWSVRQRRSKPVMLQAAKKLTARASPTTPLSWSGATSHSGGGAVDGFEESSQPTLKPSDISRSKVCTRVRAYFLSHLSGHPFPVFGVTFPLAGDI